MSKPWLLLDVSYLAYRAFYAIGKLSHDEIQTTVAFGVFREAMGLQEQFSTHRVCWCFDYGRSLRLDMLPTYKSSRKNKPADELEKAECVRAQVCSLRSDYLTRIGFQNVCYQKGYEADDVIAKIVKDNEDRKIIIVSSDHDLFQLLSPSVSIWNPSKKSLLTLEAFRTEYQIEPTQWAEIKAISGCKSDDVPGVPGVGEITALKYLRGELKESSQIRQRIIQSENQIARNLPLVQLPFPGIDCFRLKKDRITVDGWTSVINQLGLKSLASEIPGFPIKKSNRTKASLGLKSCRTN